ncbi:Uncharacterised protein [uncultured archaeon]|nr:Uncharacterised protein [uncultured archaeon]
MPTAPLGPGAPGPNHNTNEVIVPVQNVQNSTIMTVEEVKKKYLYGIPLTSTLTGETMSDDAIRNMVDAATDWLENETGISIRQRYWNQERHDYVATDYMNFGAIRLNHVPILKVTEYLVIYPDTGQTTVFPLEWVQTDMEGRNGLLQLVPGVGSANFFTIGMGNNMLPMIFKTCDFLPDLFKISYYSGFQNNKVPANILQIIGKKVQIDVLTQVSAMLLGVGVLNQSIAIDGMSQNVGKAAFAYEKQIQLLERQIAKEVGTLRSYYNGVRMTVA